MAAVPLLGRIAKFHHGSQYKTKPLENMLQNVFGKQTLMFADRWNEEMPTKVAVTSTLSVAQRAVIISNYSRPVDKSLGMIFDT
jgi:hypothetical protein